MRNIARLELHLVHACNLACESCSHYSNHRLRGILSLEDGDRWMALWSHRLNPAIFALLGGEPTIHPRLTEFIGMARRHWPEAKIQVVTNGFFLERHPNLPRVLAVDPNAVLAISIHGNSPEYWEKFGPQWNLSAKWRSEYGIKVEYWESFGRWTRRYRGYGDTAEPFEDGNPRQSWEICPARYCPQLSEGRIWKCAALAYLHLLDAGYNLGPKWRPYLNYVPLGPDCTDEELNGFFDKEEEFYCGMCPARQERFRLSSPLVHPADSGTTAARPRRLHAGSIPRYVWRRLGFLVRMSMG